MLVAQFVVIQDSGTNVLAKVADALLSGEHLLSLVATRDGPSDVHDNDSLMQIGKQLAEMHLILDRLLLESFKTECACPKSVIHHVKQ